MADQPGSQPILNASTTAVSELVMVDDSGRVVPQIVLRANSAPVDTGHPLPAADAAVLSELQNLGTILSAGAGLIYTLCTSDVIGATSTPLVIPAGLNTALILTTDGNSDVWINPVPGGTAVVGQGVPVAGGQGGVVFGKGGYPMPSNGTIGAAVTIAAIVNGSTSQALAVAGG